MDKKIGSFRDQAVAGMVEDILRQHGIHPRPVNASGHILIAGAAQFFDIWVPADEENDAREFLVSAGYGADVTEK